LAAVVAGQLREEQVGVELGPSQCSTATPSTTRQMSMECMMTGRPVGGTPTNGLWKVAR
jgi:hypothetical protein